MAITYGFFNSLNGDRKYNADTISNMFKGLISDGIYESVDHAFIVKPSSGLTLSVGSGRAIVNDKWAENDADITITLNSPHVTLNRYTAIVLRKSVSDRTITLEMIDGTEATTPAKPAILRNESYYDICLAYVYVKAGASTITASNIEDTRSNNNLCGFVHGLVEQVDTTELFNQYKAACEEDIARMTAWEEAQKAAFTEWLTALTEQLQVNTYIEENVKTYTLTDGTLNLYLTQDYDYTCIIFVTLEGVELIKDVDYTLTTTVTTNPITHETSYLSTITGDINVHEGDRLTVRILKSKIGFSTT